MNIGKSIKIYQAKNTVSNQQLAEALRVTPSWMSSIANSELAGLNKLPDLAAYFGVKASEFIAAGEE